MNNHDHETPEGETPQAIAPGEAASTAEETLAALLQDLVELQGYLTERGKHTYDLAQRFLESSRRNTDSRAYDERQATMLEYQHYIWHEIAGLVNKLIVTYSDESPDEENVAPGSSEES